jgi:hypothetical protein
VFMGGYILVKGGFVDDTFFDFDKPGHDGGTAG